MLPYVVEREELRVANSINEMLWQIALLVGPGVAGILISYFGAPIAILLDGISFWIAILCILPIKEQTTEGQNCNTNPPKSSFLKDTWSGFKYLYSNKAVWWITLGALFLTMAYGQLEIALPLYVHDELKIGAVVLGGLWMVYFIGSILGAIAIGLIRWNLGQGTLMALMIIGWGVVFYP